MHDFDFINLLGQILGFVAVVLGFFNYQMKNPRQIIIVQLATCVVFCAHYLLIDAISAFALNAVGIIRNIIYMNRDKKLFSSKAVPVILAAVMGVMGILSWQNYTSLFVIAGLVINTYCLSFKNAQNIRKSVLVSCTLVLIYDILVWSIGGAIYESGAIISAIIGLIKNRKENQNS